MNNEIIKELFGSFDPATPCAGLSCPFKDKCVRYTTLRLSYFSTDMPYLYAEAGIDTDWCLFFKGEITYKVELLGRK